MTNSHLTLSPDKTLLHTDLLLGEVYRGTLKEAEDTMNCFMDNVRQITSVTA
jgi:hypothetical protein